MAKRYESSDRDLAKGLIKKSETPPDAWPYTQEFEENRDAFNESQITAWSRNDFWTLVLAIRKRGGARGVSRSTKSHSAPKLSTPDRSRLRAVMPKKRGDVDRIPYTSRFDTALSQYNQGASRKLKDYEFWRCMLKIAKTRIRKEAQPRVELAVDALVLFVNSFNQIRHDRRTEKILINLHWAFEHLLKACVIQQGGTIREEGREHVIGFERAKNLGLNNADTKFLTYSDWKYLTWLQNFRGAAYHDLVEADETELYLISITGLKLFDKLLDELFLESLSERLGPVVLPISTLPLLDISLLLDRKSSQIAQLVRQGERERARRAARSLAELENALQREGPDHELPPGTTKSSIDSILALASKGDSLVSVLGKTAAIRIENEGGAVISLSLSGSKGSPVSGQATDSELVVAYRPVNPADKYMLSSQDICKRLKISSAVLTGVMRELKIKDNKDYCYLHGRHGSKLKQPGYSQVALRAIEQFLQENSDKEPLTWYRKHVKTRKRH